MAQRSLGEIGNIFLECLSLLLIHTGTSQVTEVPDQRKPLGPLTWQKQYVDYLWMTLVNFVPWDRPGEGRGKVQGRIRERELGPALE